MENMFAVSWTTPDRRSHFGFVKAQSTREAHGIAQTKLQQGCAVKEVHTASENQITPQSICLNFRNETVYTLF